jgi:DNA polymerase-3 subunit gamma/tau
MAEYRALYRETRPEVFSEILGQDHIVKILQHQIATGTVSHAYLFCGTRGTGKTTTARILAKAVNCTAPEGQRPCGVCDTCKAIAAGKFLDVIEIDAASNNGVDNIRELRESVKYPPSVGRRKVYIIDEVHMLSTGAFNALLKTLEEPPEHVMFILATTNPEKLPQTILSRCMRLDFKRVPADILAAHMADICKSKGVEITEDALRLLAGNADGSVRDSLSILEQCLSSGEPKLTRDIVLDFLGTAPIDFFLELTEKVMTKNISEAFMLLDDALRDGKDVRQLMKDWMAHFRNLMIAKYVQDPGDMLNLSTENIALLQQQSLKIGISELNHAIVTIAKAINDARYSTQARILMEVAIVTIASGMDYGKSGISGGSVPEPAPMRPSGRTKSTPQGDFSASAAADRMNPSSDGVPQQTVNPGMQQGNSSFPQQTAPEMQHQAASRTEASAKPKMQQIPQNQQNQPAGKPEIQGRSTRSIGNNGSLNPPENQEAQNAEAAARQEASQNPPAAAPESSVQEQEFSAQELEDIWRMTFEELERENPKLNVMRHATLASVSGNQYKVLCENKFHASVLKSEKELLDERMSRRMGRPMNMVCRLIHDGGSSDREEKLEKEAEEASKLLGVDVKLV